MHKLDVMGSVKCVVLQDKNKLITYVVASGLTYGLEEEVFHFFFKVNYLKRCCKVMISNTGCLAW